MDFLGRFVDGLLFLGEGEQYGIFCPFLAVFRQLLVRCCGGLGYLWAWHYLMWLSLGGVAQVDDDELWFPKRSTNSPYYTALQTPYSCSNAILKPVVVPVYKNREL